MNRIFIILAVLLITIPACAQYTYQNAIGMRVGNGPSDFVGVSYKYFLNEKDAITVEGIFSGKKDWYGVFAAGTYQHHYPLGKVLGLKWMVGAGVQIGRTFSDIAAYRKTILGFYPTAGLDYKIKSVPLNITLDARPMLFVSKIEGYEAFYPLNLGIAVRYTF